MADSVMPPAATETKKTDFRVEDRILGAVTEVVEVRRRHSSADTRAAPGPLHLSRPQELAFRAGEQRRGGQQGPSRDEVLPQGDVAMLNLLALGLFAVPLLGESLDALTLGFAFAVIAVVFVGKKMPVRARA